MLRPSIRGFCGVAARRPPSVMSIQSHVVYGAAGNSAAVFPMRRLGVNVFPLNTVQFSNHTQYGKWTGHVFPPEHISEVVDGISAVDALSECDAVLSGYLGSESQGAAVLDAVKRVKEANPAAIYCCDPVMGHPEKGCIVAPGVAQFFAKEAVGAADIICPNALELALLTGSQESLSSLDEVLAAVEKVLALGPKAVFVKHLRTTGDTFEMLMACPDGAWSVATPLLPFGRPPVGTGDLTSGVFLAKRLLGSSWQDSFAHTAAAYFAVMEATRALGAYELQLVAAQNAIATPTQTFELKKVA